MDSPTVATTRADRGRRRALRGGARLLVLAAVALLGVAGCGSVEQESAPTTTAGSGPARLLAPEEFAAAIAEPERVTINVHVPFEGTLPDTDLAIPFDQIESRQARLPSDRATPIAVYCMSGSMSAEAARTLAGLGFTDVVDLEGGMLAWQRSGREVSSSAG